MKTFLSFLLIGAILVGGIWWSMRHPSVMVVTNDETPSEVVVVPISITQEKFTETNFSGEKPTILGTGAVADAARAYVAKSIADFKTRADSEVPDALKEFGPESSASHYTIDINAKYMKGKSTESIIIDSYVYTGGANGNSIYKVFTGSLSTENLLTINDVIHESKQDAFVAMVKKQLIDESKSGETTLTVFPESVQNLTLKSFDDFAFDETNLYIYFDKYEIGPGALGAVEYPLFLQDISTYLKVQ